MALDIETWLSIGSQSQALVNHKLSITSTSLPEAKGGDVREVHGSGCDAVANRGT